MFKPTRGPQKPSFKNTGISHFALIRFLESYQRKLNSIGEDDSALRIELLVDFFKNDYEPGRGLDFDSRKLGF